MAEPVVAVRVNEDKAEDKNSEIDGGGSNGRMGEQISWKTKIAVRWFGTRQWRSRPDPCCLQAVTCQGVRGIPSGAGMGEGERADLSGDGQVGVGQPGEGKGGYSRMPRQKAEDLADCKSVDDY